MAETPAATSLTSSAAPTTPATPNSSQTPPATETPQTPAGSTSAAAPAPVPAEGAEGDGQPQGGGEPLAVANLKVPEGLTVDEKSMTSFVDLMNNQKMSLAERAQALVDLQAGLVKTASEAGTKAWLDLQDTWRSEAEKLPEFGGDKLAATSASIGQLIAKYGGNQQEVEGLKAAMDLTGAGNHPAVFAFLGRIARDLVKEGAPATGSAPSAKEGATLAQRLFPNLPTTG